MELDNESHPLWQPVDFFLKSMWLCSKHGEMVTRPWILSDSFTTLITPKQEISHNPEIGIISKNFLSFYFFKNIYKTN